MRRRTMILADSGTVKTGSEHAAGDAARNDLLEPQVPGQIRQS
jgi:hypothetical protein